jgi:hypothetical protein
MAEIDLQRPRVVPLVGERVAAGVPEHMGVSIEAELGLHQSRSDHHGAVSFFPSRLRRYLPAPPRRDTAALLTLNPVLVIISLVFWFWMWGIPGAILSVPMLATTKIICDRIRPLAAFGHFLEG